MSGYVESPVLLGKPGDRSIGRLIISYGIPKSASTFAWQLIKKTAIAGGLPIATPTFKSKKVNSPEDYIDPLSEENLRLLHADTGAFPVVVKTHGGITPAVANLIASGNAAVFLSYRDLRDVALSLLDHGQRSRALGIDDFADLHTPEETISLLETQIQRFDSWVTSCDPVLIPYDEICFDTSKTISRVAERLDVVVDIETILREFAENKRSIGQFNKGKRARYETEMTDDISARFISAFPQYYSKYFPDALNTLQQSLSDKGALPVAIVAESKLRGSPQVGIGDNTARRKTPPTLTELADRFHSDKGTQTGGPPHRYTYLYDLLFWPYRERAINFLEIGLAVGGPEVGGSPTRTVVSPSVQMWLSYFTAAHIFGFDISNFSHQKDPRFTFVRGDLSSERDVRTLADVAPSFDIIVDDASHASYHQQLALKLLLPKLVPGGLYIIEDLQWQPAAFEQELPPVPKTASFLQKFFENGDYIDNSLLSAAEMEQIKQNVCSFSCFGPFDGSPGPTKLIIIRTRGDVANKASEIAENRTVSNEVADEFVAAAYNAVLGRRPDPGGLENYGKQFLGRSAPQAVERTVHALLNSKEFQNRQTRRRLEETAKSEKDSILRAQAECREGNAEVLFVQTADQSAYKAFLDITEQTVSEYCARHNFKYESFRGVIRGYRNWHATFNRISILKRLVDCDYFGWVCYLDADAFVADFDFDLRAYLIDKSDVAMIAANGAQPDLWWDVNAGVFLLNLGHFVGRSVVREWYDTFVAISDAELRNLDDWAKGPDDQSLLHRVLQTIPEIQSHLIVQRSEPRLINYRSGLFIRQVLREQGSFDQRLVRLRREVNQALKSAGASKVVAPEIVSVREVGSSGLFERWTHFVGRVSRRLTGRIN